MKKETQKAKEILKKHFKEKKTDLGKLKEAYKKGKLEFDSEEIAEAILKEFKKGMTE